MFARGQFFLVFPHLNADEVVKMTALNCPAFESHPLLDLSAASLLKSSRIAL
jgi:hypothetical protein